MPERKKTKRRAIDTTIYTDDERFLEVLEKLKSSFEIGEIRVRELYNYELRKDEC